VLVAVARHEHSAAVITRTGPDPFGRYIRQELERLHVDNRFVRDVPGLKTPITFCEIFPPDDFPLYFYRDPKAPDLVINPEELDLDAIKAARIFWATVTGLSQEPSRSAHHVAWEARGRAPLTVLDLDYRPMFWPSVDEARREVAKAVAQVTVVVGNQLAIVKQGPRGVMARSRTETVEVPPTPVDVVNGLGAGDGFGGALCHGLLEDWPLEQMLRFANAAGAIVASRLECSTAMPTTAEVDEFLEQAGARR
jgi:5-dehydro-2-deoxygluconokinase